MSWPEAFVYVVLVIGFFGLAAFVVHASSTRPHSTPPPHADFPFRTTTTWTYNGPAEDAPDWADIIKGDGVEPKESAP